MSEITSGGVRYEVAPELHVEFKRLVGAYASTLEASGAAVIFSPKHMCDLIGVDAKYAFAVSNDPQPNYRLIRIPKRSGGVRIIHEPLPTLKLIQRWILDYVLVAIQMNKSATAYIERRSIKDNARIHRAQPEILKLDITSFFPSVRISSVYNTFYGLGYTRPIATLMSHLCTLDGGLPQGAPTSGALANAHLVQFDQQALEYCVGAGLRYTRYSDDITISGKNINIEKLVFWFSERLSEFDLRLNSKKTVYRRSGDRLLVTGLVVNEKINLMRSTLMAIRKDYYYISKFGAHSHAKKVGISNPLYAVESLAGRLAFAIGIRPYDKKLREMLSALSDVRRDLRRDQRRALGLFSQLDDNQLSKPTPVRELDIIVPAEHGIRWRGDDEDLSF